MKRVVVKLKPFGWLIVFWALGVGVLALVAYPLRMLIQTIYQ